MYKELVHNYSAASSITEWAVGVLKELDDPDIISGENNSGWSYMSISNACQYMSTWQQYTLSSNCYIVPIQDLGEIVSEHLAKQFLITGVEP